MSTAVFLVAGLLGFGLSFWLTQRLRRSPKWGQPGMKTTPTRKLPQVPLMIPASFNSDGAGADLDRQVCDLIGQGRLIDAIKQVRESQGCSLADARAYVTERLP